MTIALLASLLPIALWTLIAWRIHIERGKVKLTDAELQMLRLRQGLVAFQIALADALTPAIRRANEALAEFARVWAKTHIDWSTP